MEQSPQPCYSATVTKRSILLVEDNADDEELTIRALRKNGIASEVSVACDGEKALDYMFATGAWTGSDASANRYVCKPVDFKEFTATIRNLGLYWLVLNEVSPAGRPAGGV